MSVYMEYLLYHFCVCSRGWGWVWDKYLNPWWQNWKRPWESRIISFASVQHLTNLPGFPSPAEVQETAEGELSMPSWDYSISDDTEALQKLLLRKHRTTWPFWGSQWLLCHPLLISIPFSEGKPSVQSAAPTFGAVPCLLSALPVLAGEGKSLGKLWSSDSSRIICTPVEPFSAFQGLCFRFLKSVISEGGG